jgi:hypothetical protein
MAARNIDTNTALAWGGSNKIIGVVMRFRLCTLAVGQRGAFA